MNYYKMKELELEYVKNHNLTPRQAKRHIELCKPLKIKKQQKPLKKITVKCNIKDIKHHTY